MSRRRRPVGRAVCACCALLVAGCGLAAASLQETGAEDPVLEVWLSVAAPSEARNDLIRALARELARTPQRHGLRFSSSAAAVDEADLTTALALLEVRLDEGDDPSLPAVELAHAEGRVSPGWLVHAVLRAAAAVGARARVVDRRSSWIGQLVARSTRRLPPGPADQALARGLPAVVLRLPRAPAAAARSAGEPGGQAAPSEASRLLAAVARRLDGLDGAPVFEDEFLVAAGRVWLRRDLYWLCLALWLLLFWRGRRRPPGPAREGRWLFLAAALVAPVFVVVLAALPAVVAAWRPRARWPALVALLPAALYGVGLAAALLAGARLAVAVVPAVLVLATLAGFAWSAFSRPPLAAPG